MTPPTADDRARRQGYCRAWLAAYQGTEPLFVAIRDIAAEKPRWELPLPVVTAVVRFSADEVWKSDPALERAVAKAIVAHRRVRELVTSDLAHTVQQRSRVRAQALAGQRRNRSRRRR